MKKGEIWILTLPFSEGREQRGLRPGLIIADTKVGMILTIPLTSHIQALKFPYTIEIKKSQKNGLDKDSVVLLFQMQSLDKKRFVNKIGDIEDHALKTIDELLRKLFFL